MKPLINFGQSNEFGFTLNSAGQLVVLFCRSGEWEISPLTDDALKAIELNGGVSALIEVLHKIKSRIKDETKPAEKAEEEIKTEKAPVSVGKKKRKAKRSKA